MPELRRTHRARTHDRSDAAHREALADSAQPAGLRAGVRMAALAECADSRAHRAAGTDGVEGSEQRFRARDRRVPSRGPCDAAAAMGIAARRTAAPDRSADR